MYRAIQERIKAVIQDAVGIRLGLMDAELGDFVAFLEEQAKELRIKYLS